MSNSKISKINKTETKENNLDSHVSEDFTHDNHDIKPLSSSSSSPAKTAAWFANLDPYDQNRLNHVRKVLFVGGLKGAFYGVTLGTISSYLFVKYYPKRSVGNLHYPHRNPTPSLVRNFIMKRNNILIFSTFLITSIFSFIGSSVEGN